MTSITVAEPRTLFLIALRFKTWCVKEVSQRFEDGGIQLIFFKKEISLLLVFSLFRK
jgi:hypothetical protein